MKKTLITILFLVAFHFGFTQAISFSYLIPKNGYLSAPISPFSIRGIGFGDIFGVETGATLYNIPGLSVEALPFDYNKPLIGPHFAILVPVQLFLRVPMKTWEVKFLAGGFAWINLNPRINEGNMDRAFRTYESWAVANTDFDLESKLGRGLMAGVSFEFKVNKQFSIITDIAYLLGGAQTSLKGDYAGGNDQIITKAFETDNARMVIEGLELSVGGKF